MFSLLQVAYSYFYIWCRKNIIEGMSMTIIEKNKL